MGIVSRATVCENLCFQIKITQFGILIYDKLAIVHVFIEHGSLTSYGTNLQLKFMCVLVLKPFYYKMRIFKQRVALETSLLNIIRNICELEIDSHQPESFELSIKTL